MKNIKQQGNMKRIAPATENAVHLNTGKEDLA
jgi:hypothetical protein